MNISVTADGSLLSPTGGVNTIHPEPEIHENIYVTKRLQRLRNNVYNFMHILNNAERNVTNDANDATHADEMTVQH